MVSVGSNSDELDAKAGGAVSDGAVEVGNRLLRGAIERAASEARWEERVRATLDALLSTAAAEPAALHALIESCGWLGAGRGDPVLAEELADLFGAGRTEGGPSPPPRTEAILAGGVLAVIGDRVREGGTGDRQRLAAELSELVVLMFVR